MTRDIHERVREWIAAGGQVGDSQEAALQAHLRDCEACRSFADASNQVIRSLRSIPIAARPSLVQSTQTRVRLRAQELRQRQERLWLVSMSCVFVGLWGLVTTPLLWRGFAWLGEWAKVSAPVWQTSFAVFWVAPALVAGVLLIARGTHLTDRSYRWHG